MFRCTPKTTFSAEWVAPILWVPPRNDMRSGGWLGTAKYLFTVLAVFGLTKAPEQSSFESVIELRNIHKI